MFVRACLLIVTVAVAEAAVPTAWTPELSMRYQTVADVLPSPDGKLVVWAQTHAVMEGEKSEMLTHLFLAHADGTHRMQLTRGEKSCTSPAFSPDGRSLFFLSERSGKRNVYRIPVDGGEAERLTDWQGALGQYQLSPDGKWIAFTGAEADASEEKAKREKLDLRVIDESPKNQALWLIPTWDKRAPRKLAAGPYHISGPAWSPDGRKVAFETRPTPDADNGRKSDIAEVEVESGAVRSIASTSATESQPRYSPDGRYLSFVRSADPPVGFAGSRIVLMSIAGGKTRELPVTPDESPNVVDWAADSNSLYFLEPRGTKVALYRVPVDGPVGTGWTPAQGTIGGVRLNASRSHFGFVQQAADTPAEAFVSPAAAFAPMRVSSANLTLPRPALGETRVIQWKAADGKDVEGLLTYPVGYQKGKRYPLVLEIHGGPSGVFGETFIGAPGLYPIATFASRGYAVLRCNIRGSVGYGQKFRAANLNDWGGGDYQDLMSGVDHVIAMGVADPNRLGVMGWSYGGYMTNWVITQTKRFKAAAAGAGLSNLPSMWGTNDIPSTLDDYFSGPAYEQPERYAKLSPLYHVANVTTPELILHGEADVRVPTTQGYEMYNALKRRGVPAQMVVYPRTPHGPQEPKFVLDIMQRHLDWMAKYLGS